MNLISIVIPIYNLEEYLRECLNSVIRNTHINIEIILINDGSTDGSQSICEEYEKKHEYIKLVNQKNGGLSDARNRGIKEATGEYILFLDADDLLEDGILNYLEQFIKLKNKPDAVMFDYTKFYQKKNKYEKIKKDFKPKTVNQKSKDELMNYILSVTNNNFQWLICQFIYKREMILKNNLFFERGRLYEDVLWLPAVIFQMNHIEYFTQSVYIYRLERDGQITSTISTKSLLDNIYIPTYWDDQLTMLGINGDLRKNLMTSFSIRYFYSIWFLDFLNKDERKIVLKELKKNKEYLEYSGSKRTSITKYLTKLFGFSTTSKIFKLLILLKRHFK